MTKTLDRRLTSPFMRSGGVKAVESRPCGRLGSPRGRRLRRHGPATARRCTVRRRLPRRTRRRVQAATMRRRPARVRHGVPLRVNPPALARGAQHATHRFQPLMGAARARHPGPCPTARPGRNAPQPPVQDAALTPAVSTSSGCVTGRTSVAPAARTISVTCWTCASPRVRTASSSVPSAPRSSRSAAPARSEASWGKLRIRVKLGHKGSTSQKTQSSWVLSGAHVSRPSLAHPDARTSKHVGVRERVSREHPSRPAFSMG